MGGKKKGKVIEPKQSSQQQPHQPQQPPPSSIDHPEETYDRFQKLEQITKQLKALSPNKKESTKDDVVANGEQKKPDEELPKVNSKNDASGKTREEIEEERKRKRELKAAKKKPSENAPPQPSQPKDQLSQNQPKRTKESGPPKNLPKVGKEKESMSNLEISTTNLSNEPKSVLKQISPVETQKEKNLQPGNVLPASHTHRRSVSRFILATPTNVHPAFRRLAAKCEANKFFGVNELLLEFHGILIEFVHDYNGEPDMSFKSAIKSSIQPQLNCLKNNSDRHFPLAMGNLIRQFRKKLNTLEDSMNDSEMKESIIEWIKMKREENFFLAEKAITEFTIQKLKSQSHRNILTYSRCPIVEKIILGADEDRLDLHVFVVDSPDQQGKVLLEALSEQNIPCTYGDISSIGYLIEQVSIVLLGCSGILSNGRVVATRGSSLLALCAQAKNIPVLVAAKTCTFVDKVRLDEHLSTALLNEPIETIPEDLVTALVTDLRILPPSSAPAVLKAKQLANDD